MADKEISQKQIEDYKKAFITYYKKVSSENILVYFDTSCVPQEYIHIRTSNETISRDLNYRTIINRKTNNETTY